MKPHYRSIKIGSCARRHWRRQEAGGHLAQRALNGASIRVGEAEIEIHIKLGASRVLRDAVIVAGAGYPRILGPETDGSAIGQHLVFGRESSFGATVCRCGNLGGRGRRLSRTVAPCFRHP